MSWFSKLFTSKPSEESSASLAKERLQVIVAHQRTNKEKPDFLKSLQEEIMQVIAKYVEVDLEQVKVALDQQGDRSVLELNVSLPETEMSFRTNSTPSESAATAAEAKKTAETVSA